MKSKLANPVILLLALCLLPAPLHSAKRIQRQFTEQPFTFSASANTYSRSFQSGVAISASSSFTVAFWMRTPENLLDSYFTARVEGELVNQLHFDRLQPPQDELRLLGNGRNFKVLRHNSPTPDAGWTLVSLGLSLEGGLLRVRNNVDNDSFSAALNYSPRASSVGFHFCGEGQDLPLPCDKYPTRPRNSQALLDFRPRLRRLRRPAAGRVPGGVPAAARAVPAVRLQRGVPLRPVSRAGLAGSAALGAVFGGVLRADAGVSAERPAVPRVGGRRHASVQGPPGRLLAVRAPVRRHFFSAALDVGVGH
ncbi:MAG: hypothetical protein AAF368_16505 [Planctomycetota bacterium]